MHLRTVLLFLLVAQTQSFASDGFLTPEVLKAARQITDQGLRTHIKVLSSDKFEGRGTGAKGGQLAVGYIVGALKKLGVKPAIPSGKWTQRVPLVGITSHAPAQVTFQTAAKSLSLKYHEDYIAGSGTQHATSEIKDADVVFVGYGIVAPEFKWDDFKGVDVKGKVLMVMNNNPTSFAGKRRLWYGRWDYKYEQAAKMGAAGVIIIHTTPSAAYPWQVVQTSWSGERFDLEDDGGARLIMKGWATEDACKKIAALSGNDLDKLRKAAQSPDFKPVSLQTNFSIAMRNDVRKTSAENVVGMIAGTDAKLKHEGVFYTAHHDHLGIKKGAIYHGALDNASGVSALLNIAKAFRALKKAPSRSIYFMFPAAEEQGLLGSRYFAEHPPIPPSRMAANINIDGMGFYGKTRDISVSGLGKSSIDNTLIAIAKEQGRVVKGEEFPEYGVFYRSDQFNFAKIGVPAVFMQAGVDVIDKPEGFGRKINEEFNARDYHQPSDIYKESWDLSGAIEDATLEFALGVAIANAPTMPVWNKGDEFEAIRLKSLKQ